MKKQYIQKNEKVAFIKQPIEFGRVYNILVFIILCIVFLLFNFVAKAQPSGGPYGPLNKYYEIPRDAKNIYYVSADGDNLSNGDSIENPTSIENAIKKVKSGDAIILRGGTYRTGNLILNQGIIIQPYQDEQPILKGTFVAKKWIQQENGLWITEWKYLFQSSPQNWWRRHRHGADIPQHRFNNDLVFADGRFLQSAGWEGELDDNSYYIDYKSKKVYVAINPYEHEVEITAFDIGLVRTTEEIHDKKSDGKGPIIRGITLSQYASRAIDIQGYYPEKLSKDSGHGKDVVGTVLENCTISYSGRIGGNFIGDSLIIRNCRISDTSTEGIYIVASSDVLLEKNIFTRNNIENLEGYYPAAVKIFNQSYRVTCRDNLVTDLQNSIGIWYDVGNVDGVFINNWLENIHYDETHRKPGDVWPIGAGFYFEISRGAICAGNVFINCDTGVHLRDAADVQIYNNTFVNSQVLIGRTGRTAQGDHFDWHPSTGPDVHERVGHIFKNNLLAGNNNYQEPLLNVWQRSDFRELKADPQLDELDCNCYVKIDTTLEEPLIVWSTLKSEDRAKYYYSLDELNVMHNNFAENSMYLDDLRELPFKSMELKNYQLKNSFIKLLINEYKINDITIGAYPLNID